MKLLKTISLLVGSNIAALTMGNIALAEFVRQEGQPAFYYQYSNTHYCHVQSDAQMAAYGGASQVIVSNKVNLKGTFTGHCGWTNGFFRRSNQPEVYYMYGNSFIPNLGDKYCHVPSETRLGQLVNQTGYGVRVVEPSANFSAGRTYTGTCQ